MAHEHNLLKAGDRVSIPGEEIEGSVRHVGQHNVTVDVEIGGVHESRTYAHEALMLLPTMDEATGYIDH